MTNIIMKNSKPINRLFNLPSEIISYIYELARDEAPMNEFIKNYNFNFKLYRCIRETHYTRKTSIKIIKVDDTTYKYIINDNDGDINKFIIKIKTEDEWENEKKDYIKKNICYIASDIDDYKRCLKDKYYICHDYRKGMKKTTIKKLNLLLEIQDNEIIYNMLDIEIFISNYFVYNSWAELLDLVNIDIIKILKIGNKFLEYEDIILKYGGLPRNLETNYYILKTDYY